MQLQMQALDSVDTAQNKRRGFDRLNINSL